MKNTSNISETPETQKEKLSRLLVAIRPNVTKEDRKEAQVRFGITKATTSRYLNGIVNDITTGFNLYNFFKKLIDKREKALA
jgi:hypothetical protein